MFTVDLVETTTDPISLVRTLKAFEARYGFLQGPRVVSEYDPAKGITFLNGYFGRSTIDKVMIYNNGILVDAKISTDEIDAFIDDANIWAREEMRLPPLTEKNERSRSYLSQVEIESDIDLDMAFPWLKELGASIAATTKSYGQNVRDFGVSRIDLLYDISVVETPKVAVPFGFQRRDGKPYENKTYFASAPLRTEDHYRFIEKFEELLRTQL